MIQIADIKPKEDHSTMLRRIQLNIEADMGIYSGELNENPSKDTMRPTKDTNIGTVNEDIRYVNWPASLAASINSSLSVTEVKRTAAALTIRVNIPASISGLTFSNSKFSSARRAKTIPERRRLPK